jgi:hypothetical protein
VASWFLRFRCLGSIGLKPWISVPTAQRQIAFAFPWQGPVKLANIVRSKSAGTLGSCHDDNLASRVRRR